MPGEIKVEIGCNYEDFLRGLATVKKEADLAVLEQRRKDKEASDARRATARAEREERRAAEKEKQEAARQEKKDAAELLREQQRLAKEKEKEQKDAQKASQTSRDQKIGIAQGFLSGGISGGISAIGATFGVGGQLIAEAVNKLIEGFQKALHMQNLSIATGLSVGELSGLDLLAKNLGTSLESLARSFGEFNRRVGEARIKGSELNNLFNKLNVTQEELASGSMNAQRGMLLLARAHKAGTDAATLAYYGNMMYGSSFNELLPAIKRGEASIKAMSEVMYKQTESLSKQASEQGVLWNNLGNTIFNIGADIVGVVALIFNGITNGANELATYIGYLFGASPEWQARSLADSMPKAGSDEDRRRYFKYQAEDLGLAGDDLKRFNKEVEKILGESGVKLTPLGLQTAQAASSLQQMGGGDIVSAYAFNPVEETAKNTQKIVELTQQQLDEQRRGNEKSNPPKGSIYRSK